MPITQPDTLTAEQRAAVLALARRLEQEVGAPPLSDQALAQLDAPGVRHLLALDGEGVTGYAQLADGTLEVAGGSTVLGGLLATAEDSGSFAVWTHGRRSPLADAVAARGYRAVRVLHRLRRSAALPVPDRPLPDGVVVRPFRVGIDEAAWLTVNAAAFADHAEQGGWTAADLAAREREEWFDPAGFFLAWRGEELVGFHWTKVHPDGAGEVYVLGVAPAGQGSGLGAALLVVGLRHLAGRGCPSVLLYVDESNTPAMRLYEKYGFTGDDVDRQWRPGLSVPDARR